MDSKKSTLQTDTKGVATASNNNNTTLTQTLEVGFRITPFKRKPPSPYGSAGITHRESIQLQDGFDVLANKLVEEATKQWERMIRVNNMIKSIDVTFPELQYCNDFNSLVEKVKERGHSEDVKAILYKRDYDPYPHLQLTLRS